MFRILNLWQIADLYSRVGLALQFRSCGPFPQLTTMASHARMLPPHQPVYLPFASQALVRTANEWLRPTGLRSPYDKLIDRQPLTKW